MHNVPLLLTATRALLAPVMVVLALYQPLPGLFALCLVAAFLSDVFDGIIARRLGVATATLRRLDSAADTLFYAAAAFAVWHLQPAAITHRWTALTLLGSLEIIRYLLDLFKFRREASYHMWSSKLWGIALFAGFLSLLAYRSDGVLVDLMIYLGIAADIEGIAISLVLPSWRADVPSIVHALRVRREQAL